MRNIVAKRLRREAREATAGKPNVTYIVGSPAHMKTDPVTGLDVRVPGVPTILGDCTRKHYKGLKHGYHQAG